MVQLLLFYFSLFGTMYIAGSDYFHKKGIEIDTIGNSAILYIFTGSDWCVNCKRMERNILQDTLFIMTMNNHHIRVEFLDFPQKKMPQSE